MLDAKTEVIEESTKHKVEYCLIIYGGIVGLSPLASFRRVASPGNELSRKRNLKQVKCPHCGNRFGDTDTSTKVEVTPKPTSHSVPCHLYHECDVCGNVFGVKFVVPAE